MSKFKFPPSITSRPVYATLEPRAGKAHLMVADAQGADAILDLALDLATADSGLLAKAQIIYIPKETGDLYLGRLETLGAAALYIAADFPAAKQHMQRILNDAHMGLQIYLTGTEGVIGQAMLEATDAGIPYTAIQAEHRGSVARRMQCVHCKGITEDVMTDPFQCSYCGLNLYVRDHYSRRLAAFQGVCIDAEDPGNVPASEALYT